MSAVVRAIRGATTVESDEPNQITERVHELVTAVFEQNGIDTDDVISVIFSATSDISTKFPAAAARSWGLDDVPLFGTQELDVEGALPLCIRLMAHVNTTRPRAEIKHVFLHRAKELRVDLVK